MPWSVRKLAGTAATPKLNSPNLSSPSDAPAAACDRVVQSFPCAPPLPMRSFWDSASIATNSAEMYAPPSVYPTCCPDVYSELRSSQTLQLMSAFPPLVVDQQLLEFLSRWSKIHLILYSRGSYLIRYPNETHAIAPGAQVSLGDFGGSSDMREYRNGSSSSKHD